MSWQTQNALKKVVTVFKRSKERNVPIYDNDIEAIKTLNTAIENASKSQVNDNLLFAKLLAYVIDKNLHYTGDIKASIKIAADILKEPLDFHLQMMHRNINYKDLDNYLISLGIKEQILKVDKVENNKILSNNQKEYLEKLKTNWSLENVSKSFYNTANEFLQETDNYI
jgi:membrane-associated HD superfamily phosphohydrolase